MQRTLNVSIWELIVDTDEEEGQEADDEQQECHCEFNKEGHRGVGEFNGFPQGIAIHQHHR